MNHGAGGAFTLCALAFAGGCWHSDDEPDALLDPAVGSRFYFEPCELDVPEDDPSTVPAGCPETPALLTHAELDATPRDDADVEWLVMTAQRTLTADEGEYQRARCEVDRIRQVHPATRFTVFPDWSRATGVEVQLSGPLSEASRDELDCLNASLGVTEVFRWPRDSGLSVDFAGLFHPDVLAPHYQAIDGVSYAHGGSLFGDGNEIVLRVEDGVNRYVFLRKGGDCPAGCTEHDAWLFDARPDGEIAYLESWSSASTLPRPEWVREALSR